MQAPRNPERNAAAMERPRIDFARLDFPSDKLTVGALRRAFPHSFDLPAPDYPPATDEYRAFPHLRFGRQRTELALGELVDFERLLAARAFKEALSLPLEGEENDYGRDELVGELTELYTKLKLAKGPKSAGQLIRAIETGAAAQALTHAR